MWNPNSPLLYSPKGCFPLRLASTTRQEWVKCALLTRRLALEISEYKKLRINFCLSLHFDVYFYLKMSVKAFKSLQIITIYIDEDLQKSVIYFITYKFGYS